MKEHPILFSAPMIKALLAGQKTQTRRLASSPLAKAVVGDQLWVREAHALLGGGCDSLSLDQLVFRADHEEAAGRGPRVDVKWRPSIHMPRWASRIMLTVTKWRFELLQEITEAAALAEGITEQWVIVDTHCAGGRHTEVHGHRYFYDDCRHDGFESAVDAYAALWDSLHGSGAWDANPEVVALTFAVEVKS